MTKITDDELALLAVGIQFCEVSMRKGLSMAQTVDRFLTILNEYYEDAPSETATNILKFAPRPTEKHNA